MSHDQLQLVGDLVAAVASVVSAIIAAHNHRALSQVRVSVNGRLQELLDLTRTSSRAAGQAEGRAQAKDQA